MGTNRARRMVSVAAFLLASGLSAAEDRASCASELRLWSARPRPSPSSLEAQMALGVMRFRCGQSALALGAASDRDPARPQ